MEAVKYFSGSFFQINNLEKFFKSLIGKDLKQGQEITMPPLLVERYRNQISHVLDALVLHGTLNIKLRSDVKVIDIAVRDPQHGLPEMTVKVWRSDNGISSNHTCSKDGTLTKQVGGDHYKKYKIQPIEFIMENNIGYMEGNVIKYVVRHKDKGGITDLEKAKHYLQMLIEQERKQQEEN